MASVLAKRADAGCPFRPNTGPIAKRLATQTRPMALRGTLGSRPATVQHAGDHYIATRASRVASATAGGAATVDPIRDADQG